MTTTRIKPPYPKLELPKSRLLQALLSPWLFMKSRTCSIAMIPERAYRKPLNEVWVPGGSTLFPLEPDVIRRVLVEDSENFPKSKMVADVLGMLLGDSIFVSNGEVWKRQRRMMNPAFEHTRVKVVFGLMMDAARALFLRLDAKPEGTELDIQEVMTFVTADIIFRTIFSRPLRDDEAKVIFRAFNIYQEAAFAHGLNRLAWIPDWMAFFTLRRARKSAKDIRDILDPIVAERYNSFHSGEEQTHNDILQSLVSVKDEITGTYFDMRELCEQVAMLFLAGHETSASALSWSLYLLSLDQEIQDRAHFESVAVLGEREAEFSDIRQLGLTRNVFAETLRLFPPVPFLPREALRSCPIRHKTAQKGSIVSISPWMIQRHRHRWKNPDTFDPDRFDRPETREAERHCYIPFSKGPRVCLGASFALQEASIILSGLVRRYKFSPVPGFTPKLTGRLTLRSANGIRLTLNKRTA